MNRSNSDTEADETMAAQQPSADEKGFAVEPKKDCPHANLPEYKKFDHNISVKMPCGVCNSEKENWLCLHCCKAFCSRYVHGHMASHNSVTNHAIAVSFSDLSFWCYSCDSYIVSPNLDPVFHVLHVSKFGAPPGQVPVTQEEINAVHAAASRPVSKQPIVIEQVPHTETWMVKGISSAALNSNPLLDRVLGCIYGNLLGDAYGLSTEFMDRTSINQAYGSNVIPFPNFKRNFHNSRWELGDWTDDSDQMLLILETLVENDGIVDQAAVQKFARKLLRWMRYGFPELGDNGGMGLGATVARVLHHPQYLTDPHKASELVWEEMNQNAAANGGVMRTSILGCYQSENVEKVIANTKQFCRVTHHDSRCQASCVAATTAIAMLLQGKHRNDKGTVNLDALCDEAIEFGRKELEAKFNDEYQRHCRVKHISELKLDEPAAIGYTLKCVGSGFWGLRSPAPFKQTLYELAREGGDADTNGAVCGSMIGAKIGFSQLPKDWLSAMAHRDWLDAKVVQFLKLIKLV